VSYRRILAQQTLAITCKKCSSDEKINEHGIHFYLHLCISQFKINSSRVLDSSAKPVFDALLTEMNYKSKIVKLEKIKTCGRQEVLELLAVLLALWVNVC